MLRNIEVDRSGPFNPTSSRLLRASEQEYIVLVQCLIGRRADVNESFDGALASHPLHEASKNGHLEV